MTEPLADRIEIDDLLTRYATAVDTRDWDLYRTVFTADAIIDYTSSGGIRGGLDEVTRWLSESLALFSMSQHLVTNRDIRVEGDAATSHTYLYNAMGRTKRDGTLALMFVGGSYRDKLRRTADGWRITERIQDTAWFSSAPGTAGPGPGGQQL
jgi:3-phenylpropionate/cinnamic acid dioxygenase small subunit